MNFYEYLEEIAKAAGVEKIVIGAIITNEKGEVFLAKRKENIFMGGFYEIPGGNAKKGESIVNALKRGIKEETNLNIIRIVSYIDSFDYLSVKCEKCRQFNFKVEVESGPIFLTEHDSYEWVPLSKIQEVESSPEVKYGLMVYKFNEEKKLEDSECKE